MNSCSMCFSRSGSPHNVEVPVFGAQFGHAYETVSCRPVVLVSTTDGMADSYSLPCLNSLVLDPGLALLAARSDDVVDFAALDCLHLCSLHSAARRIAPVSNDRARITIYMSARSTLV